jgi:hypothetical protein
VFKALEGCLDFLARILERHHGNLPRLASQNVLFAIVGILHLIEKLASSHDELFRVDPWLRGHHQRGEDASYRGMSPGEKHHYPRADSEQCIGEGIRIPRMLAARSAAKNPLTTPRLGHDKFPV